MFWKILADIVVVLHFLFAAFMVIGFLFTLTSVIGVYVFRKGGWFRRFFGWSVFRWIHVCGIFFVAGLIVLDRYCPLTSLENAIRRLAGDGGEYTGSFIIHYVEKLLYPDVPSAAIVVPTFLIALFTIAVFIFRPPWREKSTNLKEKL